MSDIKLAEDTAAESTLHNGGVISRFMDGFRAIPRVVLWFIVVVWATPTVGLLISGLRTRDDQRSSGWWTGSTQPSGPLRTTTQSLAPRRQAHSVTHC